MISKKRKISKERKKAIDEGIGNIFNKTDSRVESGCDPFEADFQATLEIYIFMMQKHLFDSPGQLLPTQIDGQDEWDFYLDILEKIDFPPETCALLMAPSALKNLFHLLNHEDSTSQNLHGFVLESAFGIYFESIGLWINNKMVTRVYRAFYVNMVPDNEGCKGNIKFICN